MGLRDGIDQCQAHKLRDLECWESDEGKVEWLQRASTQVELAGSVACTEEVVVSTTVAAGAVEVDEGALEA